MPLHGKIVVIKRTGGDGTEFPLTATCLFGRKPDCDIRIQLPQVSKEHCRIDFNENKEIVLTNLSSVNPTRVNGEALQQAERLKHGDVITIIDRSFRFEYPPAPTPKKRSSRGGKTETLKDQQVGDTVPTDAGEKRISEVCTDPHLKDGTNHENIQRSLDKTVVVESKQDDVPLPSKAAASPFNDLYQMIKKSLDVKTPRKSSASVLQTPTSRFCSPKPESVRKPVFCTEDKSSLKKEDVKVSPVAEDVKGDGPPASVPTQSRSFQTPSAEMATPAVEEAENAAKSDATSPQKRTRTPPKRFSAGEVSAQKPKSPVRRSKEPAATSPKTGLRKASPRNSGEVKETSRKRKSGDVVSNSPAPQMKKKRVSFGGTLCPELFDKRLPPNSPLRKGAAPRRSLCVPSDKLSLLRRASANGLLEEEFDGESPAKTRKSSAKNTSPKTPTPAKRSPKSRTPSPKAASPARGRAPTVGGTPGDLPPSVQGRFSVSRINTPSPNAEGADQVPLLPFAPKTTPRRKSTSQETPSVTKGVTKVMRKRSGFSRASMKVKHSWADIVRFGPTKPQLVAPVKKAVVKKTTKKTVSKPQTPVRQLVGHVSTGHADSPVTIVVGRAHKRLVQPTGAAPTLVPNIALLKKNMNMDEDLTGISQMLKSPAVERKRCVIDESCVAKTPVRGPSSCVVEPSVLNTPEEPGEMMVSPMTVKDRRYNSEAVQRLLDDDQSFVSDAPAAEIPSDDCSEQQSTDSKTTPTTPKQEPEQHESLTDVKVVCKTPRQEAEPLETPKAVEAGVEEDDVKVTVEAPELVQESEDRCDVKLMEEPLTEPAGHLETNEVEVQTPVDCDEDVAKELVFAPEEPRQDEPSDVMDVPQVELEKETNSNEVDAHMEEVRREHDYEESSDAVETVSQASVAETVSVEEPEVETVEEKDSEVETVEEKVSEVETVEEKVSEVDTVEEKDSEVEAVEEKVSEVDTVEEKDSEVDTVEEKDSEVEAVEEKVSEVEAVEEKVSEVDTVEEKDSEVDTVKEKDSEVEAVEEKVSEVEAVEEKDSEVDTVEEKDSEVDTVEEKDSEMDTVEEKDSEVDAVEEKVSEVEAVEEKVSEVETVEEKVSEEQPKHSEDTVVPAPVRARRVKKAEAAAPPAVRPTTTRGRNSKSQESLDVDLVIEKSAVLPAKVALKPKRGRNAKKASEDLQEVSTEIRSDQLEVVPSGSDESKSSDAMETVPQETVTESFPEVEAAEAAIVQKKAVRGKRAKLVESNTADVEVVEHSEDPVVPAPVRGRRGTKTEATAPPAVRLSTRGRNAKSQGNASDDKPELVAEKDVAATLMTEVSSDAAGDQTSSTKEKASAEEAVVKPVRGRKIKQKPVEPEVKEVVSDEPLATDAQPQKSVPAVGKPKRGRKTKADAVEEDEVVEDAVVAEETKQPSQPPVKAKRGRNAKQEEEKPESLETTDSQVPAKKIRRTRKVEQDLVEPREEEEVTEAPLVAEPVKVEEEATVAAKPRRGGRKAKQEPEIETPVESTEVQEVVGSTDKLKRGRKGKRVTEEVEVTAVVAEEEKNDAEGDAPVIKPSRARGARASASQATPAKRARRGAVLPLEETSEEATGLVSEPAATSVEPAKKGRRAAAKPKAADATVTSDQANPSEDSSSAVEKDTKTSKRSIKWKSDLEVVEIPKATPVKAIRGRKTKVDTESKTVSKDVDKTEEKDLSEKVAEAQPVKRARRGAKVADVTADEAESTSKVESAEVVPQLKTRRGRSAKK
ncbi:proliferation marker protein Ki-67 isoform X2 [Cottoperca gobio]|uniref:Proliferation marker protein Ki-67 isoform X2 n=1 Tax=Cottoperca gobio TaxID=56716 RepID=A0A6J2RR58_COTGO|nr:proliferation marker protein Ki-67-like isoform X2 [Cottoperca gobio]